MRWLLTGICVLFVSCPCPPIAGQAASAGTAAAREDSGAPLPDIKALLADVERNQKRMEALQRDYTYHVHTDQQELDKNGGVKKTETEDAESLTISGVRVDKVVARNGKPLSPDEQKKESERIDKVVAKAKERQAKLDAKGSVSDGRGNEVLPLSRILELGSFSNPHRVTEGGRSLVVADYTGNPQAATHSAVETVMRDVVGTIAIDETERVLVRGEGHFQKDFKLGGGLLADVRQGSSFAFRATRVGEGVWLPATVDGQGSVRVLLFAHFNGRLHLSTSDYRRFRASATIVGSHGAIDANGDPVPEQTPAPGAPPPQTPVPEPPHP